MASETIETDYLVVGAGAAGMAFTDALIAESDADVVIVDRRHAPGGHWNDAYPFVRLHQPSAFYGVASMPLGEDRIDESGPNAGQYERASGPEVVGYYRRVMDQRLLPSGKVRYFPRCDYLGEHRFESYVTGKTYEVKVRKTLVDAKYLEPKIPATSQRPFEVASGVRCITVNDLVHMTEPAKRFVVVGAGKTAIDACLWLLESGVPPEDIRWIRPRDAWLASRTYFQPGELAFEGFSLLVEAAAHAESPKHMMALAAAQGQFFRIDESIEPTMFKYATVNDFELEQLRRITDVVRMGRIRRIEQDEIVLDEGSVPARAGDVYVHCAAPGLVYPPVKPTFTTDTITPQSIRSGQSPFAAAITGYIEATRTDLDEKNLLTPPNIYPNVPEDIARMTLTAMNAEYQWSKRADIMTWLDGCRLSAVKGVMQRMDQPRVQQSMLRFGENARNAVGNLRRMTS